MTQPQPQTQPQHRPQPHPADGGACRPGDAPGPLSIITGVGLCNLCEVCSHDIVRVAGLTMHTVAFVGGGRLCFAFSDAGELVDLHARGVNVAIEPDGRVMAGRAAVAEQPRLEG
ncbi:hypothetical protein [Azohydromonas aeria]|uniref:hypothetical protein n=1 Tax=Azohydromonas aeria TaxID=2590212 RepID=UPI0012F99518|nr:hypothetical protein [Azohydromonas aeria]